MEIGKMLKEARVHSGLTQEDVADKIRVTRQTMSNWENEKCYPDIINVIELSNLYGVSLDELLKGDEKMIEHLEQSTNTVNSNKKLIAAIGVNIVLVLLMILFNGIIAQNRYLIIFAMSVGVLSTCVLFYQIIKKI
ncbi:helix-turn-helix transcriptional regulator [Anaerorhabdus sp.]|uniref:helix-turn-helix transcriptional regulator n=1 Tax=Anaerorhabdus sp. TaxID=1872524 RepID=UPI002FC5ABDC